MYRGLRLGGSVGFDSMRDRRVSTWEQSPS